ncbi:MAG: autotransporter domain-containing protein [Candidatus Omnitrophica bacterium]|nr:autotransporter domain-containing protein [Candidatus Omnitrophota bacterium]
MKKFFLAVLIFSVILLISAGYGFAADTVKQDTNTMNGLPDWSLGAIVAGQTGIFSSVISAGNAGDLTLGGEVACDGLVFQNDLNGDVLIKTGNTLHNGSVGLDMSAANNDVTMNCGIELVASQAFNVNTGRLLTIGGDITNNASTLTVTGAGNTTISGILGSGAGGLTKSGAGTLTLSNNSNSYTGVTTISDGTLSVATISDGGVVSAIGAAASVAANLVFDGGILDYTGATASTNRNFTINAGKTASITVDTAGTTLTMTGACPTTTGGLSKQGAGTLYLKGVNLYQGVTIINDGTLKIDADTAIGDGSAGNTIDFTGGTGILQSTATTDLGTNRAITLTADGTLQSDAGTLTVGGSVTNGANLLTVTGDGNTSITGVIGAGAGGLTKAGSGTLSLSNSNTYSGGTTLTAGNITLGNNTCLGDGDLTLNGASGTLQSNNDARSISNAIDLSATATNALIISGSNSLALTGNITNAGQIEINMTDISKALTLSGANNTYTGGTTLTAGKLNINSTTALGGATSAFTISGGTIDNTSAGAITLANNNTQSWNGDFAFGGTQNLNLGTGAVTMNAARQVTLGGSTLTVGGAVDNGGNTLTITTTSAAVTGNMALSGAISGSGGLTLANGAVTTLSGAASNTYSGTTTLGSAGFEKERLTLSKTGGAVAIAGNVTIDNYNSPFLDMTQANQFGATSVISWTTSGSGNGRFQMQGTNQTVAGISSTDSANAVIQNTPWGGGAGVWSDCTLTIDTAVGQSYTWNGMMRDKDNGASTGTLALTKSGTGTQILYGDSLSYTGKTTIAGGTLQLGTGTSGGTLSTSEIDFTGGLFQYGGTNTQDISSMIKNSTSAMSINTNGNDVTFASALAASNVGGLIKSGTGTLTLSGTNLYTGGTAINGGTITASNTKALASGNVAIEGGTLDVGTTSLDLGAGSTYTQGATAASTFMLTANSSSAYGSVKATGGASITAANSTVYVNVGGYIPNGASLTVIDTDGGVVDNAPGTITSSNSYVTFSGSRSSGNLILTAVRSGSNSFRGQATNTNAAAVGNVLDNVTNPTADMTNILNTMGNLSSSQVASSENTMSPTVDGAVTQSAIAMLNQVLDTLTIHLEDMRLPAGVTGVATGDDYFKGLGIWTQVLGDYAHQDPRQSSNGYNATSWGVTGGADIPLNIGIDSLRMGIGSGYGQTFVRSKDYCGHTDIDSIPGTIYCTYDNNKYPFYLDSAFTFMYNSYTGSRQIAVGAIERTAKADYSGQQYSGYVEGGYSFFYKNLRLTPLLALNYMHLRVGSYTETGADSLNLNVSSQDYDMFQTGIGMKLAYPVELKYVTILPDLHARWIYDWIGESQATTAGFSGGGTSFGTNGFRPARSAYNLGTKVGIMAKNNVSLDLDYDFLLKEDYYEHYGSLNVRYNF